MKNKILVSSCLLGELVRYDGVIKEPVFDLLLLHQKGLVISVCPEVSGGLSVPRLPAEITNGDGYTVLSGKSDIIRSDGVSVKDAYVVGAKFALSLVKKYNIKIAILKSKSPSCSNNMIYDGSFNRKLSSGVGVSTALLELNDVKVFNENQIEEAFALYLTL